MISSIQSCIDLANTDPDPGAGERERVFLPPEELLKLGDLRRREHIQRARERRDLEVAKIVADSLEGEPLDPQRPYGLPEGMSCEFIWEMILDNIVDLEDIVPVRDTCTLFRSLLQQKYMIWRLSEAVTKFPNKVEPGNSKILPRFRLVCRSSKAAVDNFDKLSSPHLGDLDSTFYPKLELCADLGWPHNFLPILANLEERPYGPNEHFPLTSITFGDYDVDGPIPGIEIGVLRTTFENFLSLVGSRIRSFEFVFYEQNLDTYNRLGRWVILMPNLLELSVRVCVEVDDQPPPDDAIPVALPPFPVCPMLKQFSFCLGSRFNILASATIAQILQANPAINEVVHRYKILSGLGDFDRWKEAEFSASLRSLESFQLTRYDLITSYTIPPLHFLESRFAWPLKRLSIFNGREDENPAFPSRRLFAFANAFGDTLEELGVNWRMQDTGGYLVLPKVSKLIWKVWPEFLHFEFMIALENLQSFDVDFTPCPHLKHSYENAKRFIEESTMLTFFPALKKIRVVWPPFRLSGDWHWRAVRE